MYTLGIDLGTSGMKAALMDSSLRIVDECLEEYDIHLPQKGFAQQNPAEWYKTMETCLRRLDCSKVAGVGFSGQMHGLVMADEHGDVLDEAILWCDQRSTAQADEICSVIEELGRRIYNRTASGFMLASLLWIKQNQPELFHRIRRVMMPKDYLVWKMTGVFCTEPGDAVGSGALNLETMEWDLQLLERLGIDAGLFPPVVPSEQVAGDTQAELETLKQGIPVICGSGDHGMQLLGNGIFSPGTLSVNIGTSCQISGVVGVPSEFSCRELYLFAHPVGGYFSMTGTGYNGGGVFKWLRNTWYPGIPYRTLTDMAEKSVPGSNGVTFLPFLNGERGREELQGNFYGIRLTTTAADIIHACLEGIVFRIREYREMLLEQGVDGNMIVLSGGASASPFWMQIIADILQLPVYTGPFEQQAAAGAALLAGMSVEVFPSPICLEQELKGRMMCVARPEENKHECYDRFYGQYRKLSSTLFSGN
ncbi:xylulokinase [Lacrimispora brassicae]